MKVILKQPVQALGNEGEIVEVAHGYASNFLLPRGMAVAATPGALRQLEDRRKAIEKREAEAMEAAQGLADRLTGRGVEIAAKAGKEGKLYGSVTTREIAAAVSEQLGIELEKKQVLLDEHIKRVGEHEVKIKLHSEVEMPLKVTVTATEKTEGPEGEEPEGAELEAEAAEGSVEASAEEPEEESEAESEQQSGEQTAAPKTES